MMNILFSSCGRRVELVSLFKKACYNERNITHRIIGIDNNPLASARFAVDAFYLVPRADEVNFIDEIISICKREKIDLIIPLIDPELRIYSVNKRIFEEHGVKIVVSDINVIDICSSKLKTATFYKILNIPYVKTVRAEEYLSHPNFSFPVVIKPCEGSGSKNVFEAMDKDDIRILMKKIKEPIVQPKIDAPEITVDCLCDFEGRPINAVSRLRIETRAGESCKGKTLKDELLLDHVHKILTELKPIGPVTIQCFKIADNYLFSEINPRFGGGYPLSHAAGANYPKLLLKMHMGEKINNLWGKYFEDIYFTRYDQSFFFKSSGRGQDLELKIFNGYEVDF